MKSSCESGRKLCEDAILCQMPVLMAFTLTFNVPVQDSRAEFTTIDMIKVNISADSDNCIFFCVGACNVSFSRTQTENQKSDTQTDSNSNPPQNSNNGTASDTLASFLCD